MNARAHILDQLAGGARTRTELVISLREAGGHIEDVAQRLVGSAISALIRDKLVRMSPLDARFRLVPNAAKRNP